MDQTKERSRGEFDLADPRIFEAGQAHDIWRRLRAEDPVHWNEPTSYFPGFWSVTRYHDIVAVSRDPETFISGRGITMMVDPENPSPSSGAGKMLIAIDPPRHVRLRRLVNRGFTPRMVARLEPHIRDIATDILDDVAPRGECDFVLDVAARLPLAVICEMLGVPRDAWDTMFQLTNRVLGAGDPEYQTVEGDPQATAEQGQREMFGYFVRLLIDRRKAPREDLVSVLTGAEVEGERLTDEEILYFCYLLILAGNETTRNAISGGVRALIDHPDQRRHLAADLGLLPSAIEEILRWTSPVVHMARVASRDTELAGRRISAGQKVLLWYPSANRDEAVFPDPYRFDITRAPNDHLAFGVGEHFCLGSGLARLELRVIFEELLRRLPDIELAGEPQRLRSTFIGGIKHMPVRFTPAG
ncbi:MAG TPA: cytochrome P450 [Dehalococcoidia bacterium]|nr:cytochrome P450 [Dehalococcoidia bacterium]